MKNLKWIYFTVMSITVMLPDSFAIDRSNQETDMEIRQKMAKMHQMAADCFRSNRPMKECHQEMMQNCPMMEMKGDHSQMCPMCRMEGDQSGMMGEDHMGMMKKKEKKG